MNIKDKLMNELNEVTIKIVNLFNFNNSEEFKKLSKEMQNLLIIQQAAMNTYGYTLQSRIELLEKEGK